MNGLARGLVAVLALLSAPVARRVAGWRWHRKHAGHAAGPVPEVHHERDFYGSMTLAGEHDWGRCSSPQTVDLNRDWLPAAPGHVFTWGHYADPVPYQDLQSDARIEDDRDGDATAAWCASLGEDPGPGVVSSLEEPPPGPVQDGEGCHGDRGEPGTAAYLPVHETAALPPSRLADTDEIAEARGWPTMRDQDADVADWLAGRAIVWARLEIGVLA